MVRARRLCPSLAVVRPDFARYKAASSAVFTLFRSVTPLVEPLSIDEAYLDVTENAWGESLGVVVARRLKADIRETTGLTASAGVAPNKLLAKIASGWKKPDGLTVIPPWGVEAFLEKLPVEALWGVGPVTAGKLKEIGVVRLVDLRAAPAEALAKAAGSWAEHLRSLSFGIDERPVVPDRRSKSAGAERTFAEDLTERDRMATEIERLSERIAGWLEKRHLFGRTVVLKVRYSDFTTVTRSVTLETATADARVVAARALALLSRTEAASRPVRLLGVSVHGLLTSPAKEPRHRRESPQLELFADD
jgi:DNA polymerase-4